MTFWDFCMVFDWGSFINSIITIVNLFTSVL